MNTLIDTRNLTDIEIEGIDFDDAPDFSDAYVTSAYSNDLKRYLTEQELDVLNIKCTDFVYECVTKQIY